MKNDNIEAFLRNNKPQVKDNPTFLLEVQQKMCAAEGIKEEVDRQRKYGRNALILTLAAGIMIGALVMSLAYLYPVDPSDISNGIISYIRVFLDTYKQYLMLPIAGCAISLGVICGRQQGFSI